MNVDVIYEMFDQYLQSKKSINLESYSLKERKSHASIEIFVSMEDGAHRTLKGDGVGVIDAGFNAYVDYFREEHPSLSTISLSDVYFQIDTGNKDVLDLKSKTIMKLEFENDRKNKTCFTDRTCSMGYTAISVLTKAIEFYVNSELLFKRLKFLLEDAESRSRSDVASGFRYALSKVVEVTSYQAIA